ncbi:MAG TPA: energy-coupled thiamine transporter ThiT, partial [Coriobacteriia bacterium]|nr:energy-coupled thiamine transporter ThiT [Coriobacteriia bacterium]
SAWRRHAARGSFARGSLVALLPGVIVATVGRYGAHVLSGVVYFGEYAGDSPVLAYSLAYNSFVLVSALGCVAVIPLVMRGIALVRPEDGR